MKLRYAFVGLLLMALAATVVVQGQMATTRRHYSFQIVDEFHKRVTDSCTMIVYVAGGAQETVYSSSQGAAIGTALTTQTDGQFEFWTDETTVDIQITNNDTSAVVKVSSLAPTDHRVMISNSQYVAASGLTTTTLTTTGLITGVNANWTGNHSFGVSDTGVDVYLYGATASNYLFWDESDDRVEMVAADIMLDDNSDLIFGSGSDFTVESDTANTIEFIPVSTGDTAAIILGIDQSGVDLKAFAATTGDFMLWDASDENLEFVEAGIMFDQTNVDYTWAASSDAFSLTATDNASAAYTLGSTGTNGMDVILQTKTSGAEITFDAGALTLTVDGTDVIVNDSDILAFGDQSDFTFVGTSNTLTITPAAAGDDIKIGVTAGTSSADVYWYADGSGTYIMFDEENQKAVWEGVDLFMMDDDWINFGDGSDFTMGSVTAKTLDILPAAATDDYAINLGVDQSGVDVNFFGTTASDGLFWDGGADSLTMTGDLVLFTLAEAAVNQFKVDATGTGAGNVIVLETTNGGIQLNADDSSNGDIDIDAADDITITAVGDVTLTGAGTITTVGPFYGAGRVTENHSANHTLTSPTNIGTLITVDTAAVVITLPAVAAGETYTIMNIGADGTEIHVDVNGADKFCGGCELAAFDDGDKLTNTGATANKGDYVKVGYFDATGWYIIEMVGIWADGS